MLEAIKQYVRAANYLTVTQIYLQDNFLLERPLTAADIKPKLFGHWGTCPGINFTYAFLQALVKKEKQEAIFVLGPGHGFPGLQANLFLEGTLEKYYKKATRDEKGIGFVSKMFSWPYGFSSHSSPETPGLILEGGELGYSLATAYGAVLDNPDLLALCMIGDGEAETGPMAGAWHTNKLMNPATNGTVLPVLHVNGLKISGPTIFGRMNDSELHQLFSGYGYEPLFVAGEDIYKKMQETMEYAYKQIKKIQSDAKKSFTPSPKFPMIILKTPKGWTTIKEYNGERIEGTIKSHQVVMPNVKKNDEEIALLEQWLKSYKFDELFDKKTGFSKKIMEIIPGDPYKIGNSKHMFGLTYQPLKLPDAKKLEKKIEQLGHTQSNSMRMAGTYMAEIFSLNNQQKNFRLLSPDETYSNRVDDVFTQTQRAFAWPIEKQDKDISPNGRVMEMLCEHNMHGLAQGYVLTGRHAVFTTYEAFAQIFSSMAHMYQKFLKYVIKMPWRKNIASMNYLLTSTAWRQEHNGYSHQNVSFVSGMLEKQNDFVKAYFPVDDNSMLAIMEETMQSTNQMNIITAGKTPEPRWLTLHQAREALQDGLMKWDFVSDSNPHLVIVGIGDYMTKEALAAIALIKKDAPQIRIRFVNILRLSAACTCENASHQQIPNAEKYFTHDKPVIVNFHGYPETMKAILFNKKNPERFIVHGYREHGGTTTPFDMQVRNRTDRFNLAIEIAQIAHAEEVIDKTVQDTLIKSYEKLLAEHQEYIKKYGCDPKEIENWQWEDVQTQNGTAAIEPIDKLKQSRTIAFIGLSDKPERHSHRVAKFFREKGYRIIPVNPNVKEVLGEKSYQTLADIPKQIHIDIVDIFRKPEDVVTHLQQVIDRGKIATVWLAEGTSSKEAEDFAEDYGLDMITNCCIMEAYKRNNS